MRKLLRSQTAERLKTLDREVRNAARKPEDADTIHDLRVSIRRLRQELNVFEEWFEPETGEEHPGNLRKLMDRCAAVRNCDIAVEVLQAAGCLSPKLASGLQEGKAAARRGTGAQARKLAERRTGRAMARALRVSRAASKETVERPRGACCRR